MKKNLIFFLCFPFLCFAYTSNDISNAEQLSANDIINKPYSTDDYRLDDNITRAEVVGMALKIKGISLPNNYFCKNYFIDVGHDAKNNWICRAVELAADNSFISRINTHFRPQDKITKAEALSIILKAQNGENSNDNIVNDVCSGEKEAFSYKSDIGTQEWQKRIIARSLQLGIIDSCSQFYSNRNATRAEVFNFASRRIIQYTPYKRVVANFNLTKTLSFAGDSLMTTDNVNFEENNNSWYGYERNNRYIIVDPATCGIRRDIVYGDEYKACNDALEINQLLGGVVTSIGKVYVFGFGEGMDGGFFVATDIRPQSDFYIAMKLLERYYFYLNPRWNEYEKKYNFSADMSYNLRSPDGVSLKTFESWYKNVAKVVFRTETMKDKGYNTYEFLVDMTENGVKSTYKVKSKVDLENFKINNISSVKQ